MAKEMSLEEIREFLGDEAKGYTDDSLLELVRHFDNMARLVVRNFSVLRNRSVAVANPI